MVRSILSEADEREIEAAVARVEEKSATEIVIAVVPSSGQYIGFRAGIAFGWGLGLVFLLHWLRPELEVGWLLLLEPVVMALVYVILGWEPARRLLIRREEADQAVRQRAFALFAERGVHRTRDRTGLLIMISELEHRVIILGDSAVHDRLHDEGWVEQVSFLVQRIRDGQAKQGIIEVLEHLTPVLTEIAPVRPDDTNELPNAIVRG